jgi:hypothetical protein
MIVGPDQHLAIAQQVDTRIPGMPPVHPPILDQRGGTGGSGKSAHILVVREPHDALVSMAHRRRNEFLRIIDARLRMPAERLHECLYRQGCRQFAVQVAAHAVGKHQQQSLVAVCVSDPILIELAIAYMAGLVYRKIHERRGNLTI